MEDITSVVVAFVAGAVVAIIVALKKRSKPEEVVAPDTGPSSQIAKDIIDKDLQDDVKDIKDDLKGKNPAGRLAKRGNDRRRRRKK
tara:strand:- start:1261 stop:1518 length:258 start_codon:yes stop_codon:yes gene_type:complete